MKNNIKLKPCPFCGGVAKLSETTECCGHGMYITEHYVECTECSTRGTAKSEYYMERKKCISECVEAWNYRNQSDVVDANSATPTGEWISVEDRLPTKEDADKYEHVLAITRDGRVRDWGYELVIFSSKNFTHWMPLPEPPEMKGGE